MSRFRQKPVSRRGARSAILIAALLSCLLLLAACGSGDSTGTGSDSTAGDSSSGTSSGEDVSVAIMHGATFDDGGYGEAMLEAVTGAIDSVGSDNVTLQEVDRVPYTAQMTSTVEQVLQQNDLVIDIASGGPLVYEGCEKFPDKHCLEFYPVGETPENVSGMWVDMAPFYYVEGAAAGELTKSGTIGFVGGLKSNLSYSQLNSYALGCQSVRPDCKVRNIYINTFFDPPKEVEATNTLIDAGADVISHFTNDSSVLKTAGDRGVWAFANYTDQIDVAPDAYVTSMIIRPSIEASVEQVLQALVDGNDPPNEVLYGTPSPMDFPLAPWGPNVPGEAKAAAEKAFEDFSNGKTLYEGPIEDATGKVRIESGEKLDPRGEFVYSGWSWPVKGLIGG